MAEAEKNGIDLTEDVKKSDVVEIHTDEIVYDGQSEQGVEADCVLPDYCPDIFKILKCFLTPTIVSYSVTDDLKLTIEGVAYIKVLYLAENNDALQCIEQRSAFSKTVDIGRNAKVSEEPMLSFSMRTEYCNCRAVSSRRLDIRGAISCRIKATTPVKYTLPQIRPDLQVLTKSVSCCGKTLRGEKIFTVREEIETGASGIGFIISCDTVPKVTDLRIISDKAVLKGIVTVNALYGIYSAESSGCTDTEKMTAEIPVSAILDIDGITDSHLTLPELAVLSCELLPKNDSGIISCEMIARCRVRAQKEETVSIPTDIYSTEYETEPIISPIKLSTEPRVASHKFSLRCNIGAPSDEQITSVWDCASELCDIVCRPKDSSGVMLSGKICCYAIGKTAGGQPFFIEKQEPFEQLIPAANVTGDTSVDFSAAVCDTGFAIRSDGSVDITAQVDFSGSLHNICTVEAISEVTVREDKPKDKSDEFALRICFTDDAADCWSIAKQYNTTVEAVMRENEIESDTSPLSGIIVIPTV